MSLVSGLADLIFVEDTEANFTGSRLKNGMLGMTSDTKKLVKKSLGLGAYNFTSDDSLQVLLADTKVITALKTFNAGITLGAASNFIGSASSDITINTDKFKWDSNTDRLGLGTSNPASMFDITGSHSAAGAVIVDPDLTIPGSNTTASFMAINTSGAGSITTMGTGIAYTRITSMDIAEPIITNAGGGDTIAIAATLRIGNAPTEGSSNNYALWVDDGATQLDGTLNIEDTVTIATTKKLLLGAVGEISDDGTALNINAAGITKNIVISTTGPTTGSVTFKPGATTTLTIQQNDVKGAVIFADAIDMEFNTTTGTKIGAATNQKLAFWNAGPIVQPAGTGETTGHAAVGGTNVDSNDTFTGNTGSKAYTINDVVKALKNSGIMAAS